MVLNAGLLGSQISPQGDTHTGQRIPAGRMADLVNCRKAGRQRFRIDTQQAVERLLRLFALMDSTAANRQKRYRARQRASVAMVSIPVDEAMVVRLVGNGYLLPDESENRHSIGQSIVKALARLIGGGD